MKWCSRVRLRATPCTVTHQAPPTMGFSRQEYWSGLPFPSPVDLPDPMIKLMSPALASRFFTNEPPGKPRPIFTLYASVQFSSIPLFVTPWTAALQASLSVTNSRSLLKLLSIESVIPFNHLICYCPLLLPPSNFPSIRVFSNESTLRIRWSKYWSFSFSISPSNEHPGLISFRMDWLDLLAV